MTCYLVTINLIDVTARGNRQKRVSSDDWR